MFAEFYSIFKSFEMLTYSLIIMVCSALLNKIKCEYVLFLVTCVNDFGGVPCYDGLEQSQGELCHE